MGLFKQLINSIRLTPNLQAAFLANTALPFLVSMPARIDTLHIDQADLVRYFLPHYANSVQAVENAKFSFLIENLLFNFHERGMLTFSTELSNVVKNGISARREHAIADGGRRSKGGLTEQSSGKDELKWSGERIISYLELAQCRSPKSDFQIQLDIS
jgi:hypothetical protein